MTKTAPTACKGCGTTLVNTGAPIWEDYCPNEQCTYERDKFTASFAAHRDGFRRDMVMRDAARDMYDALIAALPYLETAESDEAYKPGAVAKVVKQVREAISKAEGGA